MPEPDARLGARFRPGDRVRTVTVDPPHHTRLPRYARGQVGTVERVQPARPVPDDRARRLPAPRVEHVYTVVFHARDLWSEAKHTVGVDLWESYLEPDLEPDLEPEEA
jgi:nitrile hydratase subunit beta